MNAISSTVPVVLITGALTGIGRATVLAFAREEARLDDYFSFEGKA
jgi:NAD(P)-dependent dehydrogenase (short-subunit alcohol dehydrogenase family)